MDPEWAERSVFPGDWTQTLCATWPQCLGLGMLNVSWCYHLAINILWQLAWFPLPFSTISLSLQQAPPTWSGLPVAFYWCSRDAAWHNSLAFPMVFFTSPVLNIWNCCCKVSFSNILLFHTSTVVVSIDGCNQDWYWRARSMTEIHTLTCHRDESVLLYFQVKMGSLKSGELRMWANCCMRGGMVFKQEQRCRLRRAPLRMFLSLGEVHCVLFTFFERSFAHIFFSHTVLSKIMKIYRTSRRSKAEEFAFGEEALFSPLDSSPYYGRKTLEIKRNVKLKSRQKCRF